ncbi:uncharacterized protein LOC119405552 isoform X1 [Rhipicephalus sanguineus]|uniref:uncharacterized protein LOC119405552 isoform X1 n=1 Tax=Rhipicephalus sanguineus TaxID=34632 RepID=UPI0018936C22|nr:uncharacterized protein LOC119405552 isoform X1 [Rhipicephalus sanguineus]
MAESGQMRLSHDELLQAHRKERKELQGAVKCQQYHLNTQQFEVCFKRLQSIPFPANNIVSLHLHEFLANCAIKHGIAEDTLLLCLVTATSHLMGLSSSTKICLSSGWQENPVLWSAVLVPREHSCHNFVWTLQKLLCDLHSELRSRDIAAKPVVVDEASCTSLTRLLTLPQVGPILGAHASFEQVKSVYSSVGKGKFERLALGVPVLWCPVTSDVPFLSEVRFNLCCITDPYTFHSVLSSKLNENLEFQECMWPNILLACGHERSLDLVTSYEQVADVEVNRLKALLLSIAEAHCLPVMYKLSEEARCVLPQLMSKFKQLSLSLNCRVALFKTATSQIFRLAAALYVLDGCLSAAIQPDVREYEIPAAHVWEAHDIVMHTLRIKADLLDCPLRDELFHTVESPRTSHQSNSFQHCTNGTVPNISVSSVFCVAPEVQVQSNHEQVPVPVPIPRELSVSIVQSPACDSELSGSHISLPEPQESFISYSSIIPDSEEEFVDKFHYKIRRLLICGKTLLTPTLVAQMKYVSVTDPNVPGKPRYPTQLASLFLKRVAALGFGTMLTRHDSHSKKLLFRKTDYQQLGQAQLKLLQNLRVTREQYSQGCQRPRAAYWETGSAAPIRLPHSPVNQSQSLPVKQEVIDIN